MKNLLFFAVLTSTILIPAGVGIVYFKRFPRAMKFFIALLAVGVFNETLMMTLILVKVRNLFTLHAYTLAELLLLSSVYYYLLKGELIRRFIVAAVPVIIIFSVAYSLLGSNLFLFNSLPRAAESIFIIAIGSCYMYEVAINGDGSDPFKSGVFIINGGILFYFTASFIIFTFAKTEAAISNDNLKLMYNVHSYVNAFCNLVFAYGLWKISHTYSLAR